jgi:hypothetical protein
MILGILVAAIVAVVLKKKKGIDVIKILSEVFRDLFGDSHLRQLRN